MLDFSARRNLIVLAILSLVMLLAGCGGSSSSSSGTAQLHITPANPSVVAGKSVVLTAVVDKGSAKAVNWAVIGGSANGTIAADGTYTAPSTAGSYIVRASYKDDPSVSATTTVTVSAAVSVSITPDTLPVVVPYSTLQLTANVTGTTNTAVTWTLDNVASGATISDSGLFTAPATTGTFKVRATSKVDGSKYADKSIVVSANANVRLKISGKDDVVLQLDTTNAPKTSANMVSLVNKSFYNGIYFHRYVADFVIQGGDPLTKTLSLDDASIGTGGPGYTINFETNSNKNLQYALAMAHTDGDLNSAGSQFYICLTDQPTLDGSYCVFGKVLSGFTTVDALRKGDLITTATTELP